MKKDYNYSSYAFRTQYTNDKYKENFDKIFKKRKNKEESKLDKLDTED